MMIFFKIRESIESRTDEGMSEYDKVFKVKYACNYQIILREDAHKKMFVFCGRTTRGGGGVNPLNH